MLAHGPHAWGRIRVIASYLLVSRTTSVTQYSETWEKCWKVLGTTVQWACTVVLFILQMQALKSQIIFPRVVCVWLPEQGCRSLFMSRWHQQDANNALISPDTAVEACVPFKPLFWGNVVTGWRFYLFSVLMRQGFGRAQLGLELSSLENCMLFCRITFNLNIWKFTVSSSSCYSYLSDDNDSDSPFWATAHSRFWWICYSSSVLPQECRAEVKVEVEGVSLLSYTHALCLCILNKWNYIELCLNSLISCSV